MRIWGIGAGKRAYGPSTVGGIESASARRSSNEFIVEVSRLTRAQGLSYQPSLEDASSSFLCANTEVMVRMPSPKSHEHGAGAMLIGGNLNGEWFVETDSHYQF